MTKYKVTVPPTMDVGSYSTNVDTKHGKKEKQALEDYNDARAHDGLSPVKKMPKGTKYMRTH